MKLQNSMYATTVLDSLGNRHKQCSRPFTLKIMKFLNHLSKIVFQTHNDSSITSFSLIVKKTKLEFNWIPQEITEVAECFRSVQMDFEGYILSINGNQYVVAGVLI